MAQQLASIDASKIYPHTIASTMRYYRKLHKELWTWLAENPDANKQQWPEWVNCLFIKPEHSYCFACYFSIVIF